MDGFTMSLLCMNFTMARFYWYLSLISLGSDHEISLREKSKSNFGATLFSRNVILFGF